MWINTCAVVCDGASANLPLVKELSGAPRKAYGYVLYTNLYYATMVTGLMGTKKISLE
jgi:hypothetical protein